MNALTEEYRRCEAGLCFQCTLYGRKDCQITARDAEIKALREALERSDPEHKTAK